MSGDQPRHVRFDGMCWPHPRDPAEVEWRLRYGEPSREDIIAAAAYIAAYRHLVAMPQRERNLRIASLRAAAPSPVPHQETP